MDQDEIKMEKKPQRETPSLLKARISQTCSRYFITCCAIRPTSVLVQSDCLRSIQQVIRRMHDEQDVHLYCSTIMPDHVHLLFALGGHLPISRVIAKIKGLTYRMLRANDVRWQANYYEHRLRADDLAELFARYIFLNPYKDGLVSRNEEWPGWMIDQEYTPDFLSALDDGKYPPVEWIEETAERMGLSTESVGKD